MKIPPGSSGMSTRNFYIATACECKKFKQILLHKVGLDSVSTTSWHYCEFNEMILIFHLMSYVHKSLISSSDVDSTSSVNDKSFDYFFNKHFISLDPTHFTFPLETTASTEPRLALRQISSVNYSTCILFLKSLNL